MKKEVQLLTWAMGLGGKPGYDVATGRCGGSWQRSKKEAALFLRQTGRRSMGRPVLRTRRAARRKPSAQRDEHVRRNLAGQAVRPASLLLQRAVADPGAASASDVLALQSAYGNRAVADLLGGRPAVKIN